MATYASDTATVTAASASTPGGTRSASTTTPATVSATRPTNDLAAAVSPSTTADVAKPIVDRAAASTTAVTADVRKPNAVRQAPAPLDRELTSATVVPGDFTNVEVTVYNTEGERMTDALYVGALDTFPVLSSVNDRGKASLPLLQTTYDDFVVFAESGEKNVDYAWYSTTESTEIFPVRDDEGEVIVKEEKLAAGDSGLSVAIGGISPGGA